MELVSEDENIKIVFIELPVLGQSSLLASKAAYEAFNERKYFAMHQKLINHRGKITIDNIKTFASEIDIEPNLLIENMNKLDIDFIEENYVLADKLDINGTPTFIINKNVIPGAIDKATILRLLSSN
jgi:protein-disulfide isomerase